MPQLNTQLRPMVEHFEGCSLKPYQDAGDVPTIGWGHTGFVVNQWFKQGHSITQQEADNLLTADLVNAARALTNRLGTGIIEHMNDDQFSALTSFVFRGGRFEYHADTEITMHPLLIIACNSGASEDWQHVAAHMEMFNHGLTRRRRAEALMLLSRDWTTYAE